MKNKALYGLLSGITLVVATLIAVALLNTPTGGQAVAGPATDQGMACQHAPADQGYGVVRRDCAAVERPAAGPSAKTASGL